MRTLLVYPGFPKCMLSVAAKTDYVACFNDYAQYIEDLVEKARLEALCPIGPPIIAELATLDLMQISSATHRSRGPSWLSWMANNRTFFEGCIVKCSGPSGDAYYKFAMAMIQPLLVAMAPAIRHDLATPTVGPTDFSSEELDIWEHVFDVIVGVFFQRRWPV